MSAVANIGRCESCEHWTRQPDKVFQPTFKQKPSGPPHITRYGICSKLAIGWDVPTEDGVAFDPSHCSEWGETVTTGPLFGCVHFEPTTKAEEML